MQNFNGFRCSITQVLPIKFRKLLLPKKGNVEFFFKKKYPRNTNRSSPLLSNNKSKYSRIFLLPQHQSPRNQRSEQKSPHRDKKFQKKKHEKSFLFPQNHFQRQNRMRSQPNHTKISSKNTEKKNGETYEWIWRRKSTLSSIYYYYNYLLYYSPKKFTSPFSITRFVAPPLPLLLRPLDFSPQKKNFFKKIKNWSFALMLRWVFSPPPLSLSLSPIPHSIFFNINY